MRPFIAAAAASLLTAALLTSPAGATTDDPGRSPTLPDQASDTARAHAEAALEHALQMTQGHGVSATDGRGLTLALNEVRQALPDLGPTDRRVAETLLARPTDGNGGAVDDSYGTVRSYFRCSRSVCVHYTISGQHAVDPTDRDADNTPDWVETTLATAQHVHNTYVAAGYRPPVGDGTEGPGTDLVDIYLVDIGQNGYYGYCAGEGWGKTLPAYCGVDNDFSPGEFGTATSPLGNLRVTLAHEYFHAVQFAYDATEAGWLMEATATWVEDEVYDDINDNRQFLPYGQLGRPGTALTYGGGAYGNWIFFRYLTERFRAETGDLPTLALNVWRRAGGNQGALQAIRNTLATDEGVAWTPTYLAFADANRRPGRSYSEGSAYRTAAPHANFALTRARRNRGWVRPTTRSLSAYTLRVRPGSGTSGSRWKLRARVNLARRSAARVTTYFRNGKVAKRNVRLNRYGVGSLVTSFNRDTVRWVEVTIVNAGQRGAQQAWKVTAFR